MLHGTLKHLQLRILLRSVRLLLKVGEIYHGAVERDSINGITIDNRLVKTRPRPLRVIRLQFLRF